MAQSLLRVTKDVVAVTEVAVVNPVPHRHGVNDIKQQHCQRRQSYLIVRYKDGKTQIILT